MAILKIRDAEGQIHEILALKGTDYILTEADKTEIASKINGVTEGRVLELIQENMPTSAEEVKY